MRLFIIRFFIIVSLLLTSCYNSSERKQWDVAESTKNVVNCHLTVSKFFGKGHREAYNDWMKGNVNYDEYQQIVRNRTAQYNDIMRQTDLTQYNVCAAGLGDYGDFILRQTSIAERIKCMRILSVALNENRVTYVAGKAGEIYGTVITISQKLDEDGNLIEDESGRLIRLFIPDLFKNTVRESFDTISDD